VDTGEIDAEAKDLKEQNKDLELKVAQFGEIDLTPVVAPDPIGLRKQLTERKQAHSKQVAAWNAELAGLREQWEGGNRKLLREAQNNQRDLLKRHTDAGQDVVRLKEELRLAELEVSNLGAALENSATEIADLTAEVAALPDLKPQADALKAKIEAPLDTSDLDAKLETAAADAVHYQRFLDNQAKAQQRESFNSLVECNKERLKELGQLKAAKLAQIAEASGIPSLSFDEDGNFIFEGTTAGMLSTSQLIRLSQTLSTLYPPGVDLSLIDRAESLGQDVLLLVEEAKRTNRTYLATIVGQKPAAVPADVGVFVVKDGQVQS
jgi:hypothetical protein